MGNDSGLDYPILREMFYAAVRYTHKHCKLEQENLHLTVDPISSDVVAVRNVCHFVTYWAIAVFTSTLMTSAMTIPPVEFHARAVGSGQIDHWQALHPGQ